MPNGFQAAPVPLGGLNEQFLQNPIEPDIVAALTDLLPDRWRAAH